MYNEGVRLAQRAYVHPPATRAKKFACAPPHISNKESYPNAPRMAREIAVYAWLWDEACLFELDSVCVFMYSAGRGLFDICET